MMEDGDYGEAEKFLTLLYNETAAQAIVDKLRRQPIVKYKADQICRAAKISSHGLRSASFGPVLLVRNSNALVVAAGLDKVLAAYPDDLLDCKVV